MKKKLLKTLIIALAIIIFTQITVFANTLKLNLVADKNNLKINEEVKITVSWSEKMQAADFSIKYDQEKLEFVRSELADDFINSEEGDLKTAWFSMDDVDKTKIEYTFKAKKAGKVELSTQINGGFATGELEMPTNYENATLTLKIAQNPIINILKIIGTLAVILIIIILIIKKRR